MKIFRAYKLWCALFVSLPLVCHAPVRLSACLFDGSEGDDLRFFMFRPDLAGEPAWMPFYYTQFTYFGSNPYEWPHDAKKFEPQRYRDVEAMLDDWLRAIKDPGVQREDLRGLLLDTQPDSLLNHLHDLPRFFGKNTCVSALQKPGREALWEYLLWVKRCEAYSAYPDIWEEEPTDQNKVARERDSLVQGLKQRLQSGQLTPFLQPRYAFLLLRLLWYGNGQAEELEALYQKYLAPLPDSAVLRNWALHYVAQVTPDSLERAYRFSLAFDHCDSKKLRNEQLFENRLATAALHLAKTPHEKVTLLTLAEIDNPGKSLPAIRQILHLAPGDRYLQLLVGREINKLEDWLFTLEYLGKSGTLHHSVLGQDTWDMDDDYYDLPKKWRSNDLQYLRQVRQTLLEALPRAGANRDFLQLAIAQLFLLDHQPASARKYADAVQSKNFLFELQKRLLQINLILQTQNLSATTTQDQLAGQLRWLEAQRDNILAGPRSFALAMSLCADFFEKKGLVAEAALLRNRGNLRGYFGDYSEPYYLQICQLDRRGSPEAVRRTIQLIEKPIHTAFERLLTQPYRNAWPFYDLLGTMLLREGQVAEAHAVFSHLPADFWKKTYDFAYYLEDDPFDHIAVLEANRSFDSYTKATATTRLLELEKAAAEDPAQAGACYLQLGNAWYNFSQFGHSWMMLAYSWSSSGILHMNFYPSVLPDYAVPRLGFERNYCRAEKAEFYYQKVLRTATADTETKAYAAFMLAQIDMERQQVVSDEAAENYKPGAYAKAYKQAYRETNFYKTHPCATIEEM